MRMHVLSGGRLRLRKRIYFPDASSEETIDVPVASFLIRHAQAMGADGVQCAERYYIIVGQHGGRALRRMLGE